MKRWKEGNSSSVIAVASTDFQVLDLMQFMLHERRFDEEIDVS